MFARNYFNSYGYVRIFGRTIPHNSTMKNLFISFLVSYLLIGCNPTTNNQNKTATDSTATAVVVPVQADSLSIDLLVLQTKGLLAKTQTIKVADDPVFHGAKTYQGVELREILEKYTKLKTLDPAQTQIVFECEDGYNPSMLLAMLLSRKAFVAVSDADAPKGQIWINPMKDGREMKVAPFYVVYTDVSAQERDFKWPYNLVKISLVETVKEFATVYPKDDNTMVKGYGLFQKNCMICHALNKVGGKMGPELNYPKSITEYWHSNDDIKAFVKNPTSYRNECKMPAVTYLSDKELDEILRYLQYMAKHKIS